MSTRQREGSLCGLVLLLCVGSLSGCGQETSNAKRALERHLKDPDSVQYRDVQAFKGGVVCGEYNAKNSLGGYVGYSRFIYNAPRSGDLDADAAPVKVSAWCTDSPYRSEVIKRMCDQSWANPKTQAALGCEVDNPVTAPAVNSRAGR